MWRWSVPRETDESVCIQAEGKLLLTVPGLWPSLLDLTPWMETWTTMCFFPGSRSRTIASNYYISMSTHFPIPLVNKFTPSLFSDFHHLLLPRSLIDHDPWYHWGSRSQQKRTSKIPTTTSSHLPDSAFLLTEDELSLLHWEQTPPLQSLLPLSTSTWLQQLSFSIPQVICFPFSPTL